MIAKHDETISNQRCSDATRWTVLINISRILLSIRIIGYVDWGDLAVGRLHGESQIGRCGRNLWMSRPEPTEEFGGVIGTLMGHSWHWWQICTMRLWAAERRGKDRERGGQGHGMLWQIYHGTHNHYNNNSNNNNTNNHNNNNDDNNNSNIIVNIDNDNNE